MFEFRKGEFVDFHYFTPTQVTIHGKKFHRDENKSFDDYVREERRRLRSMCTRNEDCLISTSEGVALIPFNLLDDTVVAIIEI